MALTIIILALILIITIWWFFFRVPKPEIQPLAVDENDPLMIEAVNSAKENLKDFIKFFEQNNNNSQVKVGN